MCIHMHAYYIVYNICCIISYVSARAWCVRVYPHTCTRLCARTDRDPCLPCYTQQNTHTHTAPQTAQTGHGHGQNSHWHAPDPTYRTLFPPTDIFCTPVCVPLQRRDGGDGAGRSVPPAVQTQAAREAAIAEIQAQIYAIDRRLDGPMSVRMSVDIRAALKAERDALFAQMDRILDAPTVRIPARCRPGCACSVWPCWLAPCVCMYVSHCMYPLYKCVPYASMYVCTLRMFIHMLAQTDKRTYIRTRARTRAQVPSLGPLTAQPACGGRSRRTAMMPTATPATTATAPPRATCPSPKQPR